MRKSRLFLVGNAHLDPMWQWRWQEGSAQAKATIRSALDRMKEFPDFRFVCSSAVVYEWIEEFAPDMFEEVKQRVWEGRFIVVGGWYVQPDCNMPGAEGFARQSLYSQRYFREKLGVTAKVGYNVDSFGHNAMLPQILKKSGMDCYVFMRPGLHEKEMPSELFWWQSPDGSQVLTYRIPDTYGNRFADMQTLRDTVAKLEETSGTDLDGIPLFYGVGNHGGGPTIRNLQLLEQFQRENPEYQLKYSNLTDFFAWVKACGGTLPVHRDDLQHHASGCYSTLLPLKKGIRRAESDLIGAESCHVLAQVLCGKKSVQEQFRDAWKQICFLHFHDSMAGCSVREAHDESSRMYSYAQQIASKLENHALQTISWAIDTSDSENGLPVVVFNPHGFPVNSHVHVNIHCKAVIDALGNSVPVQLVRSASQECYWRMDAMFPVEIPALGYAVYYLQETSDADWYGYSLLTPLANGENTGLKVVAQAAASTANTVTGPILENEYLRVEFENYTGYILQITDKVTGRKWLRGKGAIPIVMDEYYHDTWSHGKNEFTEVMARFGDASVEITESGPVRATIKVINRYNHSVLTQYFSLEAGKRMLSVRAEVDWAEKHKVLKLRWPLEVEAPKTFYEIPFGVVERPANGEEEPGLRWVAVKGENSGFALVNDSTYSTSINGNVLDHTILRSPIYGDHGGPRDAESAYMNQGKHDFCYILMEAGESWVPVIQQAALLNKPISHIIENWHQGTLQEKQMEGLRIDRENIMLSACKRSEDDTGYILRLYEVDGKSTAATVTGCLFSVPLRAEFAPYSMMTFFLRDGAECWEEVLLTEYTSHQDRMP